MAAAKPDQKAAMALSDALASARKTLQTETDGLKALDLAMTGDLGQSFQKAVGMIASASAHSAISSSGE